MLIIMKAQQSGEGKWRRQGNRSGTTTEVLSLYITEKVSKQECKLPDEDNLHFL